jgi:cytochrome c2
MPSFEELSDEHIKAILFYIEHESTLPYDGFSAVDVQQENDVNPRILEGKTIFRDQCQSCHYIEREGFGPALGSVTKRRPKAWLRDFVENSQAVIRSGDAYAINLYQAFDQREMVPMPFLSDEEFDNIMEYIEFASMRNNQPISNRFYQQGFVNTKPENVHGVKTAKVILILLSIAALLVYFYLLIQLLRYLRAT